jgi:hypothetical protein
MKPVSTFPENTCCPEVEVEERTFETMCNKYQNLQCISAYSRAKTRINEDPHCKTELSDSYLHNYIREFVELLR